MSKLIIALTLSTMLLATHCHAQEMDIRYIQVMLGKLDADESWVIDQDQDALPGDIEDMIYGGVVAQLGTNEGIFQYGLETGGLISYHNERSTFTKVDGGITSVIKVKNNLFIVDASVGGFASFRPWHGIRLYISAGPAILIGSMDIKDDDINTSTNTGSSIQYSPSDRKTRADAGFYGRAGIDVIFSSGFMIGASARRVNGELDFDEAGLLDLDDTQFFLSLGKAF